jgi:hypothetical protein
MCLNTSRSKNVPVVVKSDMVLKLFGRDELPFLLIAVPFAYFHLIGTSQHRREA